MDEIIVFDTETTGLLMASAASLSMQPHIIELSMFRITTEFDLVGELSTFINPGVPIPEIITKITGIDDSMVKDADSFALTYPKICDFVIGAKMMVAHNAAFDTGMLRVELERIDKLIQFPWPPVHICTVEQTMHLEHKRQKMSQLHESQTGTVLKNAHRARNDVIGLIKTLKGLVDNGHNPFSA